MSQAPHEVYSQELSQTFRRGHPIAVPHPGFKNGQLMRPVSIGDVGYIHPALGDFIRLFNIHLEPGVNGQPMHDGLPGGLDFVPMPLGEVREAQNDTPIWVSNSVNHRQVSAEVSGPFFGGSAEFESSSECGAILATPDPLTCYDALHILRYKTYVKDHIESWVHFARDQYHDITVEDIILVTGVDRTTSWATASFANTKFQVGFGLRVQFADTGSGVQLASRFSWQNTQGATVNSGPSTRSSPARSILVSSQPASVSSSTMSTHHHGRLDRGMAPTSANVAFETERDPINTVSDQTVFIRHIRAKRRLLWPGLKIEARGKNDEDGDDLDDGAGDDGSGSFLVTSSPERREFVDCLDPILDFILENSEANIAIAHDDDLADLSSMAESDAVVVVEHGYGLFQRTDPTPSGLPDQDPMDVDLSPSVSVPTSSLIDDSASTKLRSGQSPPSKTTPATSTIYEQQDDRSAEYIRNPGPLFGGTRAPKFNQSHGQSLAIAQPTLQSTPTGSQARRRRSAALSCAECRRLKLRCSRVFPCNSCVKKGCAQICPNGSLTTGKGNRFILANTEVLHEKIHVLASRVRQLEDALRDAHAYKTNERHPLLTDELLQIKRPLEREAKDELPPADSNMIQLRPETNEEAHDVLDTAGSLAISDTGKANFFGTTANAWYYLQNEEGEDEVDSPSEDQPWLSHTFPWPLTVGETAAEVRVALLNNLPEEGYARKLIEGYYQSAGWMYRPVEPDDLWTNIFSPVYRMSQDEAYAPVQSHRVAVLYLMFALAELLNLERQPYSKEADNYFKFARAALAVDSVLEEQSIQAIQALVLLCHYMFFAEIHAPRWTVMGVVVKLAQSMGLHRDSLRWKLDENEAKKRRALLWEVVTYDSWQSLTYGRPPSISMVHIDCQFPGTSFKNERGQTDMSFELWKHKFVAEVQSQVHDLAFCARPVSYKTIQELDHKCRTFPFPPSLQIAGFGGHHIDKEPPPTTLVLQRYIAHAIWEITIFYMHRGFFARALEDSPADPLANKYSQSVLAASMSACTFIALIKDLFAQHPRFAERMWFLFTHIFSCAVVLGSIAVKCPKNSLSRNSLRHLDEAIAIYEQVQTANASKVLPVLRKIRERAITATDEAGDSSPPSTPEREVEMKRDNEELATLGGKTRLVSRSSNNSPNPSLPAVGTASRRAASLSPTATSRTQPFGRMTSHSSVSGSSAHTANSTFPDRGEGAAGYTSYHQPSTPPPVSMSHPQQYQRQDSQGESSMTYPQAGLFSTSLPGSQGFYQPPQQSYPASSVSQRYLAQAQQPLQRDAYGQSMPWTGGYGRTTSPDQTQYPTAQGDARPQGEPWQGSYNRMPGPSQPTQQSRAFRAEEQYSQVLYPDANQCGTYPMSPMMAIDADAAWNALYSQWVTV
ncbi:hypothetical protein PENSPDRAFT_759311 [Peniophora sp. CONT]|nr:hypothetical protein PENSPDRAFT_759311 [Peniophora sp. CONT]